MIDKTELRIGNLVDIVNRSHEVHLPTGYVFRVIAIGLFDVQLLPNEVPTHEATSDVILTVPIRDLCGIKLTEELLLRMGFEKAKYINENCLELGINGRIDIRFIDYDCNNLDLVQDGKRISFPAGIIKFVHQLQNLYHALTQSELIIK